MPRRRGGAGRPVGRVRRTRRRRRRRRVMLVGGLVGYGVYKMSTKDADRIQQHTGVDPEELEDAELAQAMQELGIEEQKVTAADTEQGAAPPAAPAAPTGGGSDYMAELEKLGSLRDAGILTDEEFEAKKKQILGL
ncbi:MAG: hypothetical protein BMS9Abin17_1350 [Acidimicrobiia bacterium]|nr:MAG: hypothetical protein BMS9Abin17_1350 [Acidimicrobiia bacterium]